MIREHDQQALSVRASGPTTRSAHAAAHLINADLDAALSGGFLLGRSDPTDPLVTCQWRDIRPEVLGPGIELDRLSEIRRQFMHRAVREFLSGHSSKRVVFDSSSVTRRTGRMDCNRDAPAGFAAAYRGWAFLERGKSFHEWRVSERIETLNRQFLKFCK